MIQETYTFSRALHMMRYSGKKMASLKSGLTYYVNMDLLFVHKRNEFILASSVSHNEIMGSWVEVKE